MAEQKENGTTNGYDNIIKKISKFFNISRRKLYLIVIAFFVIVVALPSFVKHLKLVDGLEDEKDSKNTPTAIRNYSNSAIINENGMNFEKSPEEFWDELKKEKNNITKYLKTPEELAKILYVQLVTENLYTGDDPEHATFEIEKQNIDNIDEQNTDESEEKNTDQIEEREIVQKKDLKNVQGIIKLRRALGDNTSGNDEPIYMKYASPDVFQGYIDEYNQSGSESAKQEALTHFTIENNMAKVARYSEKESYTILYGESEDEEKISKSYEMTTQEINYKMYASKYTMPFNYLWAFLVIGDDKNFVFDLADLVYNSKIEITVKDNICTQTCSIDTNDADGNLIKTKTYIDINDLLDISLTLADVWCVKYEEKFSLETKGEEIDYNDASFGAGTHGRIDTRYGSAYCSEQNTKYIVEPGTTIEKTDKNAKEPNFVKIFLKHYNARYNIISARLWLFEILEKNADTANLVDLTKYLFYKATGSSYGVTDFDFATFDPSTFYSLNGEFYGNNIPEKVWFALRDSGYSEIATAGAMGNISWESGDFNPSLVEDGSGEGIGLCQWSFGRKTKLITYATEYKKTDWTDVDTQIEFFLAELGTKNSASDYADIRGKSSMLGEGITAGKNDWLNASNVNEATLQFCRWFESPNYTYAHLTDRYERANKYYNQFKGKTKVAIGSVIGENVGNRLTQAADIITRYVNERGFTYLGIDKTKYTYPIQESGKRTLSCASFVQSCLVEAGYSQFRGEEKYYAVHDKNLALSYFTRQGIKAHIITNLNELQPGDLLQFLKNAKGADYYHTVMVYSVNGKNVTFKGVPEVLIAEGGSPNRTDTYNFRITKKGMLCY